MAPAIDAESAEVLTNITMSPDLTANAALTLIRRCTTPLEPKRKAPFIWCSSQELIALEIKFRNSHLNRAGANRVCKPFPSRQYGGQDKHQNQ